MENHIYRINTTDDYKVELYVCNTNEIEPYREIKEMALTVIKQGFQIDACLNELELESLIDYLRDCQRHIQDFNKK